MARAWTLRVCAIVVVLWGGFVVQATPLPTYESARGLGDEVDDVNDVDHFTIQSRCQAGPESTSSRPTKTAPSTHCLQQDTSREPILTKGAPNDNQPQLATGGDGQRGLEKNLLNERSRDDDNESHLEGMCSLPGQVAEGHEAWYDMIPWKNYENTLGRSGAVPRPMLGEHDGQGQVQRIREEVAHRGVTGKSQEETDQPAPTNDSSTATRNIDEEIMHGTSFSPDPWREYGIVADADPVMSWEVLRQARLSHYTFKYDTREGRRQLGVLPPDVATLIPEAFSTFTLPVASPNGARSRIDGVPNIDWTQLFAHSVVVTQELARRLDQLESKTKSLYADARNAGRELVRLMQKQDGGGQSAAGLRGVANAAELECDALKAKIMLEKTIGQEHRRSLEFSHDQDTTGQMVETANMELNLTRLLAEEEWAMSVRILAEEDESMARLDALQESMRRSTEVSLVLLDLQAKNQTAQLENARRLSETLATVREFAAAERVGEEADVAKIRARGLEARKRTQMLVDECFALVGSAVLAALADPLGLAKFTVGLLGMTSVGLVIANAVSLGAWALRRRLTVPKLVRETSVPSSIAAIIAAWMASSARRFAAKRPVRCGRAGPSPPSCLDGVVLPPNLEERLCRLASSVRDRLARGAPLPHVLIHGSPGVGKTLLSRKLGRMCGLRSAIISGGDVGSFGRSASAEMNRLMQWAGASQSLSWKRGYRRGRRRRAPGVMLVLNEAEAVVGDRRKPGMSGNARSALNAVLLHTGEPQPGFMMVLATDRPQDLDGAILDRMDEVLHLPRPTWAERLRLAHQYFKVYFGHEMSAAGATFPSSCDGDAACHGSINGSAALTVSSPEDCVTGEVAVSATSTLCQAATCPEFLPGAARPFGLTGATSASSPVARGTREMVGRRRLGGARSIGLSPGVRAGVGRLIQRTAIVTEGFYGRDMSRLFSALQAAAYASERCELTEETWHAVERRIVQEFADKRTMNPGIITSSVESAVRASPSAAGEADIGRGLTPALEGQGAHHPIAASERIGGDVEKVVREAAPEDRERDGRVERHLLQRRTAPVGGGVCCSVEGIADGGDVETVVPGASPEDAEEQGGEEEDRAEEHLIEPRSTFLEGNAACGIEDVLDRSNYVACACGSGSRAAEASIRASATGLKEQISLRQVGSGPQGLSRDPSPPDDPEVTLPEALSPDRGNGNCALDG